MRNLSQEQHSCSTQGYKIEYDLLNISACIAVVALHVNGAVWGFSYDRYWITCLLIECVFYWAVPVFIMISGATLIDYRERYNTAKFLKKRLQKTLIPFVFWSIVAVFWAVYVSNYLGKEYIQNWSLFFDAVLNTRAMSIYWFFPVIFSLYFCIPFLSLIPLDKRKESYGYVILYAVITTSCLPLACTLMQIPYNYAFLAPLNGGGYVMFLLIGYWIAKYPISKEVRKFIIYPLGVIGLLLRYGGTLLLSYKNGQFDQTFSGYVNFPSVAYSTAVFVWFKYNDWTKQVVVDEISVIKKLSKASFGVYLIHFYILRFLVDCFEIPMTSLEWRILGIPIVYTLALGATLVMQKIPLLKNVVP